MKELTEQIADLTGCRRTLLERLLARQGDDGDAPLLPVSRSRRNYPLTASQRRLWLDDHIEAGNPAWNIVAPLQVEGPLDINLLERCFAEIIRRHEALRVTFQTEDAEPRQVVGAPFEIAAERWPAEGATTAERLANSLQQARRASLRPFDLGTGPLLRLSVAQLADNDHLLVICVHHIVADGWSTNILLGEAAELYRAAIENRRPHLPMLTLQLIDYASWEKGQIDCDAFRSFNCDATMLPPKATAPPAPPPLACAVCASVFASKAESVRESELDCADALAANSRSAGAIASAIPDLKFIFMTFPFFIPCELINLLHSQTLYRTRRIASGVPLPFTNKSAVIFCPNH